MADPSRQFIAYDQNTGEGVLSDGKRLPVDDSLVPGVSKLPPPGATPKAQQALDALGSVTSKLDAPPGAAMPAPAATMPLAKVGSTTSTTSQMGLAPGSVDKAMAPGAAAENTYADAALGAATEQHDARSDLLTRRKQDVQVSTLDAQQQAADEAQRAQIAHLNEGAIAAQNDPSVDPHRLVSSMSTGTKILTAILAALGGAGAAVSGQRNAALDTLNKAVDDDIAAQKEQIASGRIRRGNLVNYFREQGMRDEAAAAAAKGVVLSNVEKMTDIEAQNLGNDQALSNAKLLKPQLAAQREQHNSELKLQLEGQRGSSTTKQNTYQTGGTGTTAADVLKDALAKRDLKSLGETGMTHDEGTAAGKAAELDDNKGKAQSASEAIGALGTQVGLVRDAEGKWVPREGATLKNGAFWDTDDKTKAALDAAVEAYGRMQSGGVIGDDERKSFHSQLGGDASRLAVIANRLNAAEGVVKSRLKGATGGAAKTAIPYREVK